MISYLSIGQIKVPYYNFFDNPKDTVGWSHYAISGYDDWGWGAPNSKSYTSTISPPNAWLTDINNTNNKTGDRVLETPYFDLPDTSKEFIFSFYHKCRTESYEKYRIEFSIDSAKNWNILYDDTSLRKNWQSNSGFEPYSSFVLSSFSLKSLQGGNNVKFRFRYIGGASIGEGWLIDDFSIAEKYHNVFAVNGDTVRASQNCGNITIKTKLGFYNQFYNSFYNTTNYYVSNDKVLDPNDSLVGISKSVISGNVNDWSHTFYNLSYLPAGYYYIIYKHDALDTFKENNENDNVGYLVLAIDSTWELPFVDDFEKDKYFYSLYANRTSAKLLWEKGAGYGHHLSGSHSGKRAYFSNNTSNPNGDCYGKCNLQYVQFPYINIGKDTSDLVFNIWYKIHDWNEFNMGVEYSKDCGVTWIELSTFSRIRDFNWDFTNFALKNFNKKDNVSFRVKYYSNNGDEGIIFDDIYIGKIKPDLSIERERLNRFSIASNSSDTLFYFLNNSGLITVPNSTTSFYWSTDSIFDVNDIYLGSKTEQILTDTQRIWTSFIYNKPITSLDKYFIFYQLDSGNLIDEMREYNNINYFQIYQDSAKSIPYYNDLETQNEGWRHNASVGNDNWIWTQPKGKVLNKAFSGKKCWITSDVGAITPISQMHLYTPIFDLSKSKNPVIEFDMFIKGMGLSTQGLNMSYSLDGGATWLLLNAKTESYKLWYSAMTYKKEYGKDVLSFMGSVAFNQFDYAFFDQYFLEFTDGPYNGRDSKRSYRSILDIGFLKGYSSAQFRFNFASGYWKSPNNQIYEGALIDNFSIRESFTDLEVDYKKALMISSTSERVKFFMNFFNNGNYISNKGITEYYLSENTAFDSTDFYLGQVEVPTIRPDQYAYVNLDFEAPSDLIKYKYLIYKLDATNTTFESNETNNLGYWPLALDSIRNFPYLNNFNDSLVDGWHHYSKYNDSSGLTDFRIRNYSVPGEVFWKSDFDNGEMFTEDYIYSLNFYLESPVFDFSKMDSVFLSFNLSSFSNLSGGNCYLTYSMDGGNTWEVLNRKRTWHWYEIKNQNRFLESGRTDFNSTRLAYRAIDISDLKGKKNLVFRFVYKGATNYGSDYKGMRLDNFRIDETNVEYQAKNYKVTVNSLRSTPGISVDYSIVNLGLTMGKPSKTNFYWSADSILDKNDSLLLIANLDSIMPLDTFNSSVTIQYPTPIKQPEYFLFYEADGENMIGETDEMNNIGSYRIIFPFEANYVANIKGDTIRSTIWDSTITLNYSILNNDILTGTKSTTKFYWSIDSLLDDSDQLLQTNDENPIGSYDSLSVKTSISYPFPIKKTQYYLLYKVDADSVIIESDESDNIGFFRIIFPAYSNYIAINKGDTVYVEAPWTPVKINYTIINNGFYSGGNSNTVFYWSIDSFLNGNEQNIWTVNETPILSDDTLKTSVVLMLPAYTDESIFYLIYTVDSDDEVLEIMENDNLGWFKVIGPTAAVERIEREQLLMYVYNRKLFINKPINSDINNCTINVINSLGQKVHDSNISIHNGLNIYNLPQNVASGIYLITITNGYNVKTIRTFLND